MKQYILVWCSKQGQIPSIKVHVLLCFYEIFDIFDNYQQSRDSRFWVKFTCEPWGDVGRDWRCVGDQGSQHTLVSYIPRNKPLESERIPGWKEKNIAKVNHLVFFWIFSHLFSLGCNHTVIRHICTPMSAGTRHVPCCASLPEQTRVLYIW